MKLYKVQPTFKSKDCRLKCAIVEVHDRFMIDDLMDELLPERKHPMGRYPLSLVLIGCAIPNVECGVVCVDVAK